MKILHTCGFPKSVTFPEMVEQSHGDVTEMSKRHFCDVWEMFHEKNKKILYCQNKFRPKLILKSELCEAGKREDLFTFRFC